MLKMAVIGCGAIAAEMHIPCLLGVPGISLVALVDSDPRRSEAMARTFGHSIASCSLDDLAGKVDAAIIATPPDVRPSLVKKLSAMGVHMLCEKPMANDVASCRAMIADAAASKLVLAVGHMFRFYPVRRNLKHLLEQHQIAPVRRVEVTEGKPYAWKSRTGYTVLRGMVPGGVLFNAGIHSLDSLLWWFGYPTDISYYDDALGGLESNARLECRFPGGETCTYRISRTCSLPYQFQFHGDNGSLTFETNSLSRYSVTKDGEKSGYDCAPDVNEAIDYWREQVRDFAKSISSGRPPLASGEDGERAMALIEACYALKKARPLPDRVPQPGIMW